MSDTDLTLLAWQRQAGASYGFAARAGRRMKIGLAEVAALEQLQTHGPMTPGAIGTLLAMPSGSVTALVDRLEAKHLVTRKANPEDRRGYFVTLSATAMDRAALDLLPMAEKIKDLAGKRSQQELATINAFLDEIANILDKGARSKKP